MAKVTIRFEGAEELQRKLQQRPIYAGPWTAALQKAVKIVMLRAHARAPRGETGRLDAAITSNMDASVVPLFGIVSTNAVSAKGFRYPFALESGHRGDVELHYATGVRRAKRGKSTRRWLGGALSGSRPRITRLLERAARQIEAEWGR